MKKNNKKKMLPKYEDAIASFTSNMDANGYKKAKMDYSVIGDVASSGADLLSSSDNRKSQYAGSVLKGASLGAQIGANPAAVASTGGLSLLAIPLMAGAGVVKAEIDRKKYINEDNNKAIARNAFDVSNMNSIVSGNYAMNNNENERLPMVDKGMSRFSSVGKNFMKPNAILAKEETTVDGSTGIVSRVPGKYNMQRPDTVKSHLTENTTIHSMNPKFKIPGGDSTPADIMARTILYQKKAEKVLWDTNKFAPIDVSTAKLNKVNIKAIDTQLADYGDKVRSNQNPNSNKFDKGGTWSDIATLTAQAVPAFVNMSATPDKVQTPIYADYVNTNRRYAISNQINDIDNSSAMAKYNYSKINTNRGDSAALATELYAKKLKLKASVYDAAEDANYKYQKDYNTTANAGMDVRRSQYEQYLDKVEKTKANADTIRSQGMYQMSTAIQGSVLNKNRKQEQVFNAMQWASIAKDLPTDQRDMLLNQILSLTGANMPSAKTPKGTVSRLSFKKKDQKVAAPQIKPKAASSTTKIHAAEK